MATAEFEINDDLKTLKATELRLGLPGSDHESPSSPCVVVVKNNNNKRCSSENQQEQLSPRAPAPKSQVVGWPPVRCYRKNALNNQQQKQSETITPLVKVSMDGAPYLRKIDLNCYKDYSDLLKALEIMFNCNLGVYSEREGCHGSEYAPTYEDKDGDWMLVGDVPWDMFARSCKRVRIMKGSQAKGGVKQQLL